MGWFGSKQERDEPTVRVMVYEHCPICQKVTKRYSANMPMARHAPTVLDQVGQCCQRCARTEAQQGRGSWDESAGHYQSGYNSENHRGRR